MEEAASVTVRSRIIDKCRLVTLELRSHGLKSPIAYLVAWIGAGGGGGGLEAQETMPPAKTEAARARRAYFMM